MHGISFKLNTNTINVTSVTITPPLSPKKGEFGFKKTISLLLIYYSLSFSYSYKALESIPNCVSISLLSEDLFKPISRLITIPKNVMLVKVFKVHLSLKKEHLNLLF